MQRMVKVMHIGVAFPCYNAPGIQLTVTQVSRKAKWKLEMQYYSYMYLQPLSLPISFKSFGGYIKRCNLPLSVPV